MESGPLHSTPPSLFKSMSRTQNLPPRSLGLGGDGDEIAALREVERRFGVQLDYSDTRTWLTAGDVFAALRRALPVQEAGAAETWPMFAEAISAETGVDPTKVEPQTLLLGTDRFDWRLATAIAVIAALGSVFLFQA
jgi:hypothetical protein